ncbi:MAG: Uma2 family endonuclease [Pyrinomonadaceae bacterium]|nr:Uma2 family endonuclease [Pyrinomonadaceae bacterium]
MNVSTSTMQTFTPVRSSENEIHYPDYIEGYIPEGITHFWTNNELAKMLAVFFAEPADAKVFGNSMLYYEKGNVKKVVSPDIMVCFGLENVPTRVYKLWEQKIVPSVVIEIASEKTLKADLSTKVVIYQKLGVSEYYIFDAEYSLLTEPLIAFQLEDGELVEKEVKNNRVFSDALQLELVDTGKNLRFFNPKTNEFLMTAEETQMENQRIQVEFDRVRDENEKLKAEIAQLKQQNQNGNE